MRLIDAEKTKFFIADVLDIFKVPVGDRMANNLIEIIDNLPTVDAVKVVRCGNCKYYVENHYGDMVCQHPEQDGDWLDAAWLNTNPDDFCSHGENKEASPHGAAK